MSRAKLAITLDGGTVARIDRLVKARVFPNRSRAIEQAVEEKLERLERTRLARESAKLDPAEERELAEEGISEELSEWPSF
jgi:metal-responsive CopG/Arc/MetJ family transcriptional regulator